jgi:hypothetical protein
MSSEKTLKSRIVWWAKLLAIVLGGLFGLLIVFLAVLIVPDQVRPIEKPLFPRGWIAEPGKALTLKAKRAARESEAGKESKGSSGKALSSTNEPAVRESSPTLESLLLANDPAARQRFIESLRPIPDMSKVPENARAAAEKWNKAMDGVSSEMLSLFVNRRTLDRDAWTTKEQDVGRRHSEIRNDFIRETGDLGYEYPKPEEWCDKGYIPNGTVEWSSIRLVYEIERNDRIGCALWSRNLAKIDRDNKEFWIESGKNWYRQAGIRGRIGLAFWSAAPITNPIMNEYIYYLLYKRSGEWLMWRDYPQDYWPR